MRVSHSVRTPAECAELHDKNIELNVSLLDQRFLTGDRVLYARLLERLPRFIHGQRDSLVRNLSKLTRERHEKYASTFYHLEPNIKETPGGFRDLQLIAMAGPDPPGDPAAAGDGRAGRRTGRGAPLSDSPALPPALPVRTRRQPVHFRCAGIARRGRRRRHDAHLFPARARHLPAGDPDPGNERKPGQAISSRSSATGAHGSRTPISPSRGNGSHFRYPQQLDADPWLLLRLFQFVGRHGIRLSHEAEERIAARLPKVAEYFSESRPLWPALKEMLALPHAAMALRAMHETGALRALLPEFEKIECLVIRDFYHRYTVDEHTLVTIQTLEDLRSAEPGSIRKRYADLLAELNDTSTLYFALVFHDVGKGVPGAGHVDGSLRLAEFAMSRIQMPPAERETVLFLIRGHLEMSEVMQSRDIYDPATAQYMAQSTGTVERLKQLTLLTYADISAVNPAAMTPWRAEHLSQLYIAHL